MKETSTARADVSATADMPGLEFDTGLRIAGPVSRNYDAATGTFAIHGLLPGLYTIHATAQDVLSQGRGPSAQSFGSVPVAVSTADVDGLVLNMLPSAAIPGRLRLEGEFQRGSTIDRFRVVLSPLKANLGEPAGRSQYVGNVSLDGTFRINNVPSGDYRLEVVSTPARLFGAGGFTREARFDGADVLTSPLHFSGSSLNGLDIVVTAGGGTVDGTLTDARSEAVPSAQVVLIPDRNRFRPDLFRVVTTDQSGRFKIPFIPPGDYRLFAWESIEEYSWFDPDVLSRFETRGRAVHVTESSADTIDLRLIPSEDTR